MTRAAMLAAAVAAALHSAGAAAQDQTAQTKEKIEVTGTSIKRVEGETALPVTVMSREQIEKSGATTPMELLNYISANNSLGGVMLASTIGATTNSAQLASLRGLQGAHTLVLINGKRVNGFSGEIQGVQGTNLAIIPFNAIERVEILKDGASAIYGSDAIAGVINFIMRSDYQGAEASAYYGQPTRSGGGAEEKYAASLGFGDLGKDRYNVFLNASYDHQKPLDQKDRNFSNNSTDRFLTQLGGFAGSSNTYPGNFTTGHIGLLGATGTSCPGVANVFVDVLGGCFFDPAQQPGVESIPEDKNTNLFLQGKLQLTPTWQAYAHALYGDDKNRYIIQGAPISNVFVYGPHGDIPSTVTMQPDSPFYPHAAAAAAGVDGQPLNVRWRTTPLGNRDTTDTNTGYQIVGGLKGTISDRWDTDVSYSYAEGKTTEHTNGGFFLFSRLLPILNSGQIDLGSANLPADQLALLHQSDFIGDVYTGKSSTGALNAKVSGDLFDMPAGTAAGAIGIDYRKEKLDENPAEAYLQGDITGYGGSSGAIHGDRDVKAAFAEVNLPLLRSLELDAAIRTDDYSDFGRTNNPKFSLRFQPTRDVLFRTSYGKGFLAPSLYQLDLPQISGTSPTGLSDPVRCPVTGNTGIDCVTQFGVIFGGNPNSRGDRLRTTPTSGTSTHAATATISAARASSAIAPCRGVGGSFASATSRPRRPISVSSPSATTTPSPAPATTAVPACSIEDRSASGASASTGSGPFAAATGSPVSLDSSVAKPSASTTRASAATTPPASTSSTSPTTSAPAGTAVATPARRTSALGALRARSACNARFARTSEIASTALTSTMIEKIAIASRSSPKIAESAPTTTSSS